MPGDPNMFTSNIFVPVEAAVSPPTMAASEAPTNWHEPAAIKPGTACIEELFKCMQILIFNFSTKY